MTLATDEFIRRFLMHVLPKGLHRIRHYAGFFGFWRAARSCGSPQSSHEHWLCIRLSKA
jgi:hypothetical protein